ncbi:MAG TPA: FABP family protein [Actinomycetota bacterium]|nr:FABP family protein [Actinomycetota bacterium]
MALAVHPDLSELAFLLGTWRGSGDGEWPRGEPFTYGEELSFEHAGEPYLLYAQRSWSLDDQAPIHFERGFVRPAGAGRVELVLAHPLGVAEVAEGTVRDGVIEVGTTSVSLTGTAHTVTELTRRIEAAGEELRYELHMAMRDIGLTSHVRSRLRRT